MSGNNIKYEFPAVETANEDGLLTIGGPLNAERVIAAYRLGIFPWFNRPPVLWWFMNPRFVIFPEKLHISKSLKKEIQKSPFTLTFNQAFKEVVLNCRNVKIGFSPAISKVFFSNCGCMTDRSSSYSLCDW